LLQLVLLSLEYKASLGHIAMVDSKLFYINGKWTPPVISKTLDVENPATEQVIAQISLGSQADVDRGVAAARAAFDSFSQTSVADRVAQL
jgi:aldehyde dehydrogenase (NAD+)